MIDACQCILCFPGHILLIALERGSSGESIRRPSHFYMKSLEGYNGRYWFRTSGLFDEVGDRRGIPLGTRFQSPPPEPDGRVSTHPALRRHLSQETLTTREYNLTHQRLRVAMWDLRSVSRVGCLTRSLWPWYNGCTSSG